MKHILLVASSIALLSPDTSPVFACSCIDPASPRKELRRATAVFVGQVIAVNVSKTTPKDSILAFDVRFEVEKYWKGVRGSKITVASSQNMTGCGLAFREGEKYLVYAYGRYLEADICTRSTKLDRASEEIKELGASKMVKGGNPTAPRRGTPVSGAPYD